MGMGRFIVWTEAAFEGLEKVFGSRSTASEVKKGFSLPRSMMTNSDLPGVINSDEIQAKVRVAKKSDTAASTKRIKKNPLKNLGTMIKLNPYAKKLKYDGQRASASKSGKQSSRRPSPRRLQAR